jgi:hypothetical protein
MGRSVKDISQGIEERRAKELESEGKIVIRNFTKGAPDLIWFQKAEDGKFYVGAEELKSKKDQRPQLSQLFELQKLNKAGINAKLVVENEEGELVSIVLQ